MKVGDLVKPAPAYRATAAVGIIVEKHYCGGGGHLEPETVFQIQWPDEAVDALYSEWQDFELELVSESR